MKVGDPFLFDCSILIFTKKHSEGENQDQRIYAGNSYMANSLWKEDIWQTVQVTTMSKFAMNNEQ